MKHITLKLTSLSLLGLTPGYLFASCSNDAFSTLQNIQRNPTISTESCGGNLSYTDTIRNPSLNPTPGQETYTATNLKNEIARFPQTDRSSQSQTQTQQNLDNFYKATNQGAANIGGASSTALISNTIQHTIVEAAPLSQTQYQQNLSRMPGGFNLYMADLKYERVDYRTEHNSGNIGGFTLSGSYDFNKNYSIGAVLPYDYLSFNFFETHRTGMILYAKGQWDIQPGLQFSAGVNGNYLYNDITRLNTLNTSNTVTSINQGLHVYGGGFTSRIGYDQGGTIFSALSFSFQYNQDNTHQRDDHQYLVKLSPSIGYRIGQKAAIKFYGVWNNDTTHYHESDNRARDSKYFDVGFEGSYYISPALQLKGGYKKILGLQGIESDMFYAGSSINF